MNEIDFIGTVTAIFMAILFAGVSLFIVFIDPIDRWLEKMKKKFAKPA